MNKTVLNSTIGEINNIDFMTDRISEFKSRQFGDFSSYNDKIITKIITFIRTDLINIQTFESHVDAIRVDVASKNSEYVENFRKKIFYDEIRNTNDIKMGNENNHVFIRKMENGSGSVFHYRNDKFNSSTDYLKISKQQIYDIVFSKIKNIRYQKYLIVLENKEILKYIQSYIENMINGKIKNKMRKRVFAKYKSHDYDENADYSFTHFRPIVYNVFITDNIIDILVSDMLKTQIRNETIDNPVNNIVFDKGAIHNMVKFRFNLALEVKKNIDRSQVNFCYVFVDIQNAYPSSDINNVINLISDVYNVNQYLLDYLSSMYHNIDISYKDNKLSKWNDGLFQGVTSSQTLFVVYLDIILKNIIKTGKRCGILPKSLKVVGAYVDDIVLYFDNFKSPSIISDVFEYVREQLNQFNLSLNLEKTKLILKFNGIFKYLCENKEQCKYTFNLMDIVDKLMKMKSRYEYTLNEQSYSREKMIFLGLEWYFLRLNDDTKFEKRYLNCIGTYRKLIDCLKFYKRDNKTKPITSSYFIQNDLLYKFIKYGLLYYFINGSSELSIIIDTHLPELKILKKYIFKYMLAQIIKISTRKTLFDYNMGYHISDDAFKLSNYACRKYGTGSRIIDLEDIEIIPSIYKIPEPKMENIMFDKYEAKLIKGSIKFNYFTDIDIEYMDHEFGITKEDIIKYSSKIVYIDDENIKNDNEYLN